MSAIYAVGDIHGHLDALKQALAWIKADGGPNAQIVFLGDYVDRGSNSKGVIEFLAQWQAEGRNWICLMGSHDKYLIDFLNVGRAQSLLRPDLHWFDPRLDGPETLRS